jgi:UDP-N-acetylmuramoyl-L-alanyl-D-glutamate--2,6-diaminopimelate ligase
MLLGNALQKISEVEWTGARDVAIQGIAYDSRSVQKGDLFVAIRGKKTDGAQFVMQAVSRGAVAVASELRLDPIPQAATIVAPDARKFLAEISRIFYDDPCNSLRLIAITGTKGKTTTTYMMESIYRQANIQSCLAGTIEMKIGDQKVHSEHTTPESPDLLRFFHNAVNQGCTHGVLEVSSHALALKRVFGAKFAVGVFTNLTHDHLDFHTNMESYYQAKRLLFMPENGNRLETSVINTDDAFGKRLAHEVQMPVVTFGFDTAADIHVIQCQNHANGTDLRLQTPAGEAQFHSPLIGRPNIYNMMAATGAAVCLNMDLENICAGIESLAGVPGRMERVDGGQDFLVLVDYAHSPDSLENLLKTVSQLPHRQIITVFGCGGDRDRSKRPIMGAIATNLSDFVIATSDNPRTEDPMDILGEIEPGLCEGPAPYTVEPDRRHAIASAISIAHTGDVVVIAGKGHEDYQIIGPKTFPFDDRMIALESIHRRLGMAPQSSGST